jgi:hypothetical protein
VFYRPPFESASVRADLHKNQDSEFKYNDFLIEAMTAIDCDALHPRGLRLVWIGQIWNVMEARA